MITQPITEEIRREALQTAEERDKVAKKKGRPNGAFHKPYTSIEINWQGAIAEVILQKEYPHLKLSQPLVVDSENTLESDFIYRDLEMEVKCNRFYGDVFGHPYPAYEAYFINVHCFEKKKHLFNVIVCCGINEAPKIATFFYIFGSVAKQDVPNYRIVTEHHGQKLSSPTFPVPLKDLKPPESFEPFIPRLEKFMFLKRRE